jgi:hypothetical protein
MEMKEIVQALRSIVNRIDDENMLDSIELENTVNELRDVLTDLEELPDLAALTTLMSRLEERFTNFEEKMELVATHAAPIIAEVASSPMFRMLPAGKGK